MCDSSCTSVASSGTCREVRLRLRLERITDHLCSVDDRSDRVERIRPVDRAVELDSLRQLRQHLPFRQLRVDCDVRGDASRPRDRQVELPERRRREVRRKARSSARMPTVPPPLAFPDGESDTRLQPAARLKSPTDATLRRTTAAKAPLAVPTSGRAAPAGRPSEIADRHTTLRHTAAAKAPLAVPTSGRAAPAGRPSEIADRPKAPTHDGREEIPAAAFGGCELRPLTILL